ncbi:MAG: hypothetical protein ACRDQ5_25945 [Sciscionella sp.]
MDTRDIDMAILDQIRRINHDTAEFATGILTNELNEEDQISFAQRLVELAIAIKERATSRACVVVEGSIVHDSDGRKTQPGES